MINAADMDKWIKNDINDDFCFNKIIEKRLYSLE
jgi:hypothetical protein